MSDPPTVRRPELGRPYDNRLTPTVVANTPGLANTPPYDPAIDFDLVNEINTALSILFAGIGVPQSVLNSIASKASSASVTALSNRVGALADLTTDDKTSIVLALNELKAQLEAGGGGGGGAALPGSGNTATGTDAGAFAGANNTASGFNAGTFAGRANTATGYYAVAVGGVSNITDGTRAVNVGGTTNTASGQNAINVGGEGNTASEWQSGNLAGSSNNNAGYASVIVGGQSNTITSTAQVALIAGSTGSKVSGTQGVVLAGQGAVAAAANSVAFGTTQSRRIGQVTYGASTGKIAQGGLLIMVRSRGGYDSGSVDLTSDGYPPRANSSAAGSNMISGKPGQIIMYSGRVMAVGIALPVAPQTGAHGPLAMTWEIKGTFWPSNLNSRLRSATVTQTSAETIDGWSLDVSVDSTGALDTRDLLRIVGTCGPGGPNGDAVYWSASVDLLEYDYNEE